MVHVKRNDKNNNVIHVWEKLELSFEARGSYSNPYTEVEVWVDLEGPGFQKRVYGFWDGGNIFRVRVVATAPGEWFWRSGSNQNDPGLNGKKGSFIAVEWTEEEKEENPNRRGFIQPTKNGHALQYADGTPFFLLGDTWWAASTFRYKWYEDDTERDIGPEMGFKDMVRYRKAQGFNCIAIIAAFPNWANDGKPARIRLNDAERTGIRDAWQQAGTQSAKDMHNEGGRPFFFPGKVPGYEDVFPDVDRINPAYFKYLDRKIDYLNSQGFVPFIEVARRDVSEAWKKFYDWPLSYSRYIQYVFARYQANNCIMSPIHYDSDQMSIPSKEYNIAANLVIEKYGPPPFGTLLSANAHGSTLVNFGGPDEAKWLTLHQIGNWREHDHYWYLTEIFRSSPARPALNGEPYYAGGMFCLTEKIKGGSTEDNRYCRSAMYGSFLSGGFAGHIYGAEGLWGGDIEPDAPYKMWESLTWKSADEMRHLKTFAMVEGERYRDLVPNADLISPNKAGDPYDYKGWAYCARTDEKDFFLLYFEKDCPRGIVRGALPNKTYKIRWFNPRTGTWHTRVRGSITSDATGRITLPPFPSDEDWGMLLVL